MQARTDFVIDVLASARGASDIDAQLLATACALSGGEQSPRRRRPAGLTRSRRRRAEHSFRAACSLAVPAPVALAEEALRTLLPPSSASERSVSGTPGPRDAGRPAPGAPGRFSAPDVLRFDHTALAGRDEQGEPPTS